MTERNEAGEVRAAGGVVCRFGESGVEVLLIHRPQFQDWTIPKGKVEPGESDAEAARREVEEETGICGTLAEELPSVRWTDHANRPKVSRYWRLVPDDPEAARPRNEVDAVVWLSIDLAMARLTYPRDRAVLAPLRNLEQTSSK